MARKSAYVVSGLTLLNEKSDTFFKDISHMVQRYALKEKCERLLTNPISLSDPTPVRPMRTVLVGPSDPNWATYTEEERIERSDAADLAKSLWDSKIKDWLSDRTKAQKKYGGIISYIMSLLPRESILLDKIEKVMLVDEDNSERYRKIWSLVKQCKNVSSGYVNQLNERLYSLKYEGKAWDTFYHEFNDILADMREIPIQDSEGADHENETNEPQEHRKLAIFWAAFTNPCFNDMRREYEMSNRCKTFQQTVDQIDSQMKTVPEWDLYRGKERTRSSQRLHPPPSSQFCQ
jgi:hypothetical protein